MFLLLLVQRQSGLRYPLSLSFSLFFSHVSPSAPPSFDSLISASLHLSLKGEKKKKEGIFPLPSMFRPVLRLSCLFCISSAIQDIRRGKQGSGYFVWNNVLILLQTGKWGNFTGLGRNNQGRVQVVAVGSVGLVQVKGNIQVEKWHLHLSISMCSLEIEH